MPLENIARFVGRPLPAQPCSGTLRVKVQAREKEDPQSKDQLAKEYLAGHHGGECILFVGVAQEKTRVWRAARRRDPATGKPYPWLYQEQAMAGHWYFYGFDADFGPFHIKFCGYFPYTGQIYYGGHQYAKQQCRKEGIAFTALDNAFGTVSDPAADPADLRRADRPEDLPVRRPASGWPGCRSRSPAPTRTPATAGSCRAGGPGSPRPWPRASRSPGGSSPGS